MWQQQKVDRFYGQVLSQEQCDRIKAYHRETAVYDVPQWVYALRFATMDTQDHYYVDEFHQWDYGLDKDCEALCRNRNGRIPFDWFPSLWENLAKRREFLTKLWDARRGLA